jgi:hypothetical protein
MTHRNGGNRRCSGGDLKGFHAAPEADDQDSEAVYFISGEMNFVRGKAGTVTNA